MDPETGVSRPRRGEAARYGRSGPVDVRRRRRVARRRIRASARGRHPAGLTVRGGVGPMTVVIDARATVRAHIGGVERVAREMAIRLPLLRPERYRVLRPPAALAHRAGHLWEQAVLPLAARRDELVYCPANLAPLASRRNVIVIHDVAALRYPEWYGSVYARYQRALLPALARRARRVLTVSEFSKGEIVERLGVSADARRRGAERRGRALPPRRRRRRGPALARARAAVRAGRGHADRAQEPQGGVRGGPRARGRRDRAGDGGLGPRLHAPGAGDLAALARLRARPPAARPVRRRPCPGHAFALRGVRPSVPRGDGLRDAGGGLRSSRPAGGVRRRRAARGPHRHRRGGRAR